MRLAVLLVSAAGVLATCADATAPTDTPPPAPQSAIPHGPYVPGQSYTGRNNYIEYLAGNAPVILSAPHGGNLTPAEIPDRTASACGGTATTTTDLNTRELTLAMRQRFFAQFGTYPHVVINHLHRRKLDANREILEAACNDAEAQIAWNEFHDFLGVARDAVLATAGRGWYMDMHGHGHSIQRLELGYLLSGAQLRLADATLDGVAGHQLDQHAVRGRHAALLLRRAARRYESRLAVREPRLPCRAQLQRSGAAVGRIVLLRRLQHGALRLQHHGGQGGRRPGRQPLWRPDRGELHGRARHRSERTRFADATATVLEEYLRTHWDILLLPPTGGSTLSVVGYRVQGVQHADLSWAGASGATVHIQRNGTACHAASR